MESGHRISNDYTSLIRVDDWRASAGSAENETQQNSKGNL